ncbi:hypothetical protein DOE76_02095 [Leifsonia sp. ku-ls]|nr:hypothetical protein DOE76_02095 [Leifsonia sp. ku-ls]
MRATRAIAVSTLLAGLLAGCHQAGAAPSGPDVDDSGSTVHTADPSEDPNYWTDDRMRDATPAPMPGP